MTRTEISWLHISDLHFFVEADTKIILEDMKSLAKHLSPAFMIITGDFRHIKKDKTYDQALDLLPKILSIFHLKKKDVFIVPGNHDVSATVEKTYKSARQRNINRIVQAQKSSSSGNYHAYADYYDSGAAPLKNAFEEYTAFVKAFYADAGLKADDARLLEPASVFCAKWKNEINIIHINTALISDGRHDHNQMCDVTGLFNCSVDTTRPTIMIGHHNLEDLYEAQIERIIRFAELYNISAYFSGDIHRFKSGHLRLRKPYDVLPCLSCPKSVPQAGDSYSNVGVMYYSWKRDSDNEVEIQAFEWKALVGYKINEDYKYDINNKQFFFMKIPNKNTAPPIIQADYSTKMKYVDTVAQSAHEKEMGEVLANAILLQDEQNSSRNKNPYNTFCSIYDNLVSSRQTCPLVIYGRPGTGKSALLSLLYLKLSENRNYWTHYVDLQWFDEKNELFTSKQLHEEFHYIDENIPKNRNVVVFIDGLNEYNRLKPKQEQLLRDQIELWQVKYHITVVCSIGVQDADHYPPFTRFSAKTPITSETKIYLRPIDIKSVSFGSLTDRVLDFKEVYRQHPEIKTKSDKVALRNRLIYFCQQMDGPVSTFRTILFLVDRYLSLREDLFSQQVALLLRDYFHSFVKKDKMARIASRAAEFLLNDSDNERPSPYCLKSDAFLDFFFAVSYVNYLTQNSIDSMTAEDLKRYDCIFTARINRFVVQLVCSDKSAEEAALTFICRKYSEMPIKAKNQAVYLLGRCRSADVKAKAEKFLFEEFEKALKEYSYSQKSNDEVMLIRSLGISLLKLGCTKHADAFYELLIFDENMSRINRHFHITYYMNGSYKLTDNDVVENRLVYDFNNIKNTYDFLYHSIEFNENPQHQCVNIITIIDLVINYIYSTSPENKGSSEYFMNFKALIKKLSSDVTLVNPIVKKYVVNISSCLDNGDPYIIAFTQIYKLKDQLRKGWLKPDRKINIKQRTESVADHIWACCMLAQMLLPDNVHDSDLIDKDECSPETDYSKQKVISLLLVHDLPESITGDIPSPDKTKENNTEEHNAIATIGTMSVFPSLSHMRSVVKLWQEYTFVDANNSINARLAYDIDKLEPLIQLYLYRESLERPNDFSVAEAWVSGLKLRTKFGINLLRLIESHFINPEAFGKSTE